MPPRDPFKYPGQRKRLTNWTEATKAWDRRPHIGVTQGGSSRKDSGAKVAATDGVFRPERPKRKR
jgi:hypothetical protein